MNNKGVKLHWYRYFVKDLGDSVYSRGVRTICNIDIKLYLIYNNSIRITFINKYKYT